MLYTPAEEAKMLTRREFLKALAGTGMILGLPLVGRAQTPIRIGHQVDLSGSLAIYGYWQDKALRAAVAEVGEIAGRPLELLTEDTESNPATGVQKLRRLIQQDRVDFVIGSQHSGICKASLPLARELKTVYFPLGEATELTSEWGNRYSFKVNHTVRSHVQVSYKWAVENLGKRWTIVVADYAFGQSHAAEWPPRIQREGGEVLKSIAIPLDATDFLPYLTGIDVKNTDVLLYVFPGSNVIRFLEQADSLGILEQVNLLGVICSIDGIGTEEIPALEGSWYVSNHPRLATEVPERLRDYDAHLRHAVGVDDEGYELGGGRAITGSHYWYAWEALHLLKEAIEESGWQGKEDNPVLIEVLEGIAAEAGFGFPQGDILIRAQDHQGFHDHYIERVEDGKLRVKLHFERSEAVYPPEADYTQEGF
jgi:branched-chain amino acid transport system substrate-binding protein